MFSGLPGPHLTKVMRNGGAVLAAATLVREHQRVPLESGEAAGSRYDYVDVQTPQDVVSAATKAYLDDPTGHVLIAWKNDTRNIVNAVIRQRLGHAGTLPVVGEPLVVRKNSHKKGIMNGDVVRLEHVGADGPTLAGIPTRWFSVREETAGRTVSVLAPTGDFSGVLPYVGLDTWKRALKDAKVDDVVPMTFAYCLTAHLAQGSQYRRVTVLSPGDFRNAHYCKMTRLPDGTTMAFSWRHLYTSLSRAVERVSLILAK